MVGYIADVIREEVVRNVKELEQQLSKVVKPSETSKIGTIRVEHRTHVNHWSRVGPRSEYIKQQNYRKLQQKIQQV